MLYLYIKPAEAAGLSFYNLKKSGRYVMGIFDRMFGRGADNAPPGAGKDISAQRAMISSER